MNRLLHTIVASSAIALACSATLTRGEEPADRQAPLPAAAVQRPQIEVCFVLDTTGSMSGLIEGAKQKIWSIANQLIAQDNRPQIRFALIGYRDRGDAYITQVHDLSDDIDAVFGHLQTFKADGGGDGPESVNQALHEAVHKVGWSDSRDVTKIIFLVGDAPPHMDYANDIPYTEVCKQAMGKDLIINTVQCGLDEQTKGVWQEIAKAAEGSYVAIAQGGNMTVTATPFDDRLAEAARKMNETVVAYGDRAQLEEVESKLSAAASAPASVVADRAAYNASDGGKALQGAGDLVADVAEGKVKLEELAPSALPAPLQSLSPEEQQKVLADNQAKRQELNKQIAELTEQRAAYLAAERERRAKDGSADAFDEEVGRIVQEQAARKEAK